MNEALVIINTNILYQNNLILGGFIVKKFGLIIAAALGIFALTGCSAKQPAADPNASDSSTTSETSEKTIYKTKVTKIAYDNSCDWLVSGKTDAPNGSKIYVIPANNNNYSEGENQASSDGAGTWAKVDDGEFYAHINGVTLIDDNAKANDKVSVRIFALPKYKKSMYSELSTKLLNKARKLSATSLTVSAAQIKYLDSLDDDKDDSSASSSESSSSSSSSSSDSNSPTVEYNAITGENNARTHAYGEFAKSDKWVGESYHISKAEVMQAEEEGGQTMLLVYTDDDPSHLFMVAYNGTTDAIEDDYVDIQGIFSKRQTYDTSIGGNNTVPSLLAKKITVVGQDSY